jgi:hypothetical protein
MSSRILVIATSSVGADEIDETVERRFGRDAEVHVVAPTSQLSRLQWLTNEEDDARQDAEARAGEVADALPGETVAAGAGDADPLQAIDDALRLFPADEIVVLTKGDEATWLESGSVESARERFDLPVTRLVVG